MTTTLTARVELRCTAAEYKAWLAAAADDERKLSDWVRVQLRKAAPPTKGTKP